MSNENGFSRRNALVRSHKSDAVLHRVNYDEKGVLGSTMRESLLLPDRMVQSEERGLHFNGRGYPSYVSKFYRSVYIDYNLFGELMFYLHINISQYMRIQYIIKSHRLAILNRVRYIYIYIYLYCVYLTKLSEHAASFICQQTHANRTPEDCPKKAGVGQIRSNRPPASTEPIETAHQYNYRIMCT